MKNMTRDPYKNKATITLDAANALIKSVLKAGETQGLHLSVSVTDAGGHLQAFGRHDLAAFLTVDMALDKAWTACSFGKPTHIWNQLVQDPHMAPIASRSRMVAVGGGYPIIANHQVIGGLGVSGGTHEQDRTIAEQALTDLGFELS
ncbi:heme-binding protein [Bombella sp. TMW 2.2543]|uniref:Heme-binding protein n=1 Tax=Bombella pluederhausensis TaxID=2967336 RepID=A0ABT3WIA1_9PROT|nr:heme-binding protein [Bombella pluederhausensis]MCX5618064.1 heme-binding protein [Bombella pluederhausensis]